MLVKELLVRSVSVERTYFSLANANLLYFSSTYERYLVSRSALDVAAVEVC